MCHARASIGSLPAPCARRHAASTRATADLADRCNVLDDTGLVVPVHQRHDQRVRLQRDRDLSGSTMPSDPGRRYVTVKPSRSSCRHGSSTAACSVRDVITCRPRLRLNRAAPRIARLFASVAPEGPDHLRRIRTDERGDLDARLLDARARCGRRRD
jgi:hypothetical protein